MAIESENLQIKIVGKRSGEIAPTLENAEILLQTMRQLRGGKSICPRGVYRFQTFEFSLDFTANFWYD